jgi:hypothetical protein
METQGKVDNIEEKGDAEVFNKPLDHYATMSTIFENSMITGKYAKGLNQPLGVGDAENEVVVEGGNGVPTTPNIATNTGAENEHGGSSSVTKPNKRAKTIVLDGDPFVATFTSSSERLATAIEELATGNMDLPPDLYTILQSLPSFNSAHISFYYAHWVANPHVGRAFYNLPFDAKMKWVVDFITQRFPEN